MDHLQPFPVFCSTIYAESLGTPAALLGAALAAPCDAEPLTAARVDESSWIEVAMPPSLAQSSAPYGPVAQLRAPARGVPRHGTASFDA